MGLLANRFGPRFDVVDDNLATNLREHREARALSQDDLAQRMNERGFSFSQSTIWKIEQGKRPVKISELVALADALGTLNWTTLLDPPVQARHHRDVELAHRRAGDAYAELKIAATDFLEAQVAVAVSVHSARVAEVAVNDLWTSWLREPAERAVIEARIESGHDESSRLELVDELDKVVRALREQGYEPLIDINEIESNDAPAKGADAARSADAVSPTEDVAAAPGRPAR